MKKVAKKTIIGPKGNKATIAKKMPAYQSGGKMKKKSNNPADSYPANKDKRGVPTIGGGEGTRPPFGGSKKPGKVMLKGGGKMKKCKGGC